MSAIREEVKRVLVEVKAGIEPHLEEKSLITEGLLDSLDIMQLIMKLEEAFEIEIDPEDVLSEKFESVETIEALVEKCKK